MVNDNNKIPKPHKTMQILPVLWHPWSAGTLSLLVRVGVGAEKEGPPGPRAPGAGRALTPGLQKPEAVLAVSRCGSWRCAGQRAAAPSHEQGF